MEWLKSLLSENSTVSAMRVMAFIALFIGAGLAFAGMYAGKDLNALSVLVGVFVGAAFGGKMVQKFAEVKSDSTKKPE
jgi:uncharacterized membrane protein YiaA